MFNSILVVCVGNICRSPTGERILQVLLKNKKIDSAGIAAVVGHDADKTASLVAEEHGISLSNHVAKQITKELCHQNDLILVMEKKHIELVCKIAPEVRGKIMLFGHWDGGFEISDPYRQSKESFSFVYEKLYESATQWAKKIG
ncbi:protein tyrosine phosphatase [Serratia fonticola]|uniref:arsenate reductase/protein-tyrosine-phosphatase family protein n=1 Tax=Serratia fonticola TaxID=47917 RepID=UPI003AAC7790